MEPQDALLTIAELAVGLLGFAGVVVAFRASSEPYADELQLLRLTGLMGSAASVLILAVLPLYSLAGTEPVAWDHLCGIQALVLASFAGYFLYRWRRLGTGSRFLGGIGVLVTFALAAYEFAGWARDGDFQQYLVGLQWQLVGAAILFVRMAQVSLVRPRP